MSVATAAKPNQLSEWEEKKLQSCKRLEQYRLKNRLTYPQLYEKFGHVAGLLKTSLGDSTLYRVCLVARGAFPLSKLTDLTISKVEAVLGILDA